MKTIEEKAKAYDEAIEKARQIHDADRVSGIELTICEEIFPELKESEDERIRKALMQNLKERFGTKGNMGEGLDIPDVLAWFEKQGEHANFCNKIQIGDRVTRNEDGVLVNLSQLNRVAKKQGEQIPANSAKTCKDEQNPAWSEEDDVAVKDICDKLNRLSMTYVGNESVVCQEEIKWLKSLKDRKHPQPKHAWSGGDESHLHSLITHLEQWIESNPDTTGADIQGENIAWLKSLKDRYSWKPSDKQMDALKDACDKHWEPDGLDPLYTLWKQLKKLKE